ncbi:MAG: hypothetical protein IT384_24540 [Deltaproteobacteria bacterium]|nr:hypothetical protein [Deltaproteobacteria bacterium]
MKDLVRGRAGVVAGLFALAAGTTWAGAPPVVALVELRVRSQGLQGQRVEKRVRVAHPKGWVGDQDDPRFVRLIGPGGEGEILIAAVGHPSELGEFLGGLKERHPSAAPSPPQAAEVLGINPVRGERATRFVITGGEIGEMMMIERGEVIVLFAAVVQPTAWPEISAALKRCYPTVEVLDGTTSPR